MPGWLADNKSTALGFQSTAKMGSAPRYLAPMLIAPVPAHSSTILGDKEFPKSGLNFHQAASSKRRHKMSPHSMTFASYTLMHPNARSAPARSAEVQLGCLVHEKSVSSILRITWNTPEIRASMEGFGHPNKGRSIASLQYPNLQC